MSRNTSLESGKFATALVDELNRVGVFAKSQFRIPGTHSKILDIYIASPVRAYVELNYHNPPPSSAVQHLLLLAEQARRHFGGEIVPILVTEGEPWGTSPEAQELRATGYFITNLRAPTTDVQSAQQCAKEIRNFLVHLPYRFKGVQIGTVSSESPRAVAPSPGSFGVAASRSRKPASDSLEARMEPEILDSRLTELESALKEMVEGEFTSTSQLFDDVLISLKSVLSPEQFEILETELSAFSEEYRHEHYTACALRIGRTLEHVIYALARDWGVKINRTTLQVLSDLGKQFEMTEQNA